MGRLLEALIAENEQRLGAIPAIPAIPLRSGRAPARTIARIARIAKIAATQVAKPEVDQQARLLAAIRALNFPDAMLGRFDATDRDLAPLTDAMLMTFVRAAHDTESRFHGIVPADETAVAVCNRCGPVWTAPEVAGCAPVISGMPFLLGCPWCHPHAAGVQIPRPTVTCGSCRHFMRDHVNPEGGAGSCETGCDPPRAYPNALHHCERWRPLAH